MLPRSVACGLTWFDVCEKNTVKRTTSEKFSDWMRRGEVKKAKGMIKYKNFNMLEVGSV